MKTDLLDVVLYGVLWAGFGCLHSLLARDFIKDRLKPALGAAYRLAYNGFAVLNLAVIYLLGFILFSKTVSYNIPSWAEISLYIVQFLGWLLMILALKDYDLARFSGLAQLREHRRGQQVTDDEDLHFDGFHQWVRHPLYVAGFLILWGRITTPFDLWTAVFASFYFWIGSIFEERHLIKLYGEPYILYKRKVPAFIPYKGRQNVKDLTRDRI